MSTQTILLLVVQNITVQTTITKQLHNSPNVCIVYRELWFSPGRHIWVWDRRWPDPPARCLRLLCSGWADRTLGCRLYRLSSAPGSACSLDRDTHTHTHTHKEQVSSPTCGPDDAERKDMQDCLPVFWVICLFVIVCLHLGSMSSLFLFCFRHWRTFFPSDSVQNRWKK